MPARRWERGTTLPETAIIVAVLLALVFGIFEFGRALYTYNLVADMARKGARWAIVRGSLCTRLDHCPASADDILTYVKTLNGGGLDPTLITVDGAGTGAGNTHGSPIWTTPLAGSCLGTANAYNVYGCQVNVTVRYPFNFMLPYMPTGQGTCSGSGSKATICISSTSKMIIAQ
jgi:Flp pilus assembly protein TadG